MPRTTSRTPILSATAAFLVVLAVPGLARAQSATSALPDGVGEAASMLEDAAENALLVRDLLGANVTGPDGSEIGTVENFVVVPGGRIVAALVETSDGERLPVPFSAVKLERKAGAAAARLEQPLSELRDSEAFGRLQDAVPGSDG